MLRTWRSENISKTTSAIDSRPHNCLIRMLLYDIIDVVDVYSSKTIIWQ